MTVEEPPEIHSPAMRAAWAAWEMAKFALDFTSRTASPFLWVVSHLPWNATCSVAVDRRPWPEDLPS